MLPPPRLSDLPPLPRPADADPGVPRRELLSWTLKVCLAAGIVGFGVTQYLSRKIEGLRAPVLARAALPGPEAFDPETTGSISGPAGRVALDPCVVDLRLR